jgi:putative transposase
VRFAFIQHMDAEKAYSVVFMCRMLKVSRSAYYDWKDRPLSATSVRRERLKQMITAVSEANYGTYGTYGTYGYRRVHARPTRATASRTW